MDLQLQAYLDGIAGLPEGSRSPEYSPAWWLGNHDRLQGYGYVPLMPLPVGQLVTIPQGAVVQMGYLRSLRCFRDYRVQIQDCYLIGPTRTVGQLCRPAIKVFWRGCAAYQHSTILESCWYFDGQAMASMGLQDQERPKTSRPQQPVNVL